MFENRCREFAEKARSGRMPLGAVVTFADAAVTEVLCAAGFDFVWIDGEHGVIDRKTAPAVLLNDDGSTNALVVIGATVSTNAPGTATWLPWKKSDTAECSFVYPEGRVDGTAGPISSRTCPCR